MANRLLYFVATPYYNPSNVFLARNWSKCVTCLNIPSLKLGKIRVILPNFQNRACCEKYLKDNKHNSLHLARKYALIFALGRYLFAKTHSFPRASVSENCSLLGTDNICPQKATPEKFENARITGTWICV